MRHSISTEHQSRKWRCTSTELCRIAEFYVTNSGNVGRTSWRRNTSRWRKRLRSGSLSLEESRQDDSRARVAGTFLPSLLQWEIDMDLKRPEVLSRIGKLSSYIQSIMYLLSQFSLHPSFLARTSQSQINSTSMARENLLDSLRLQSYLPFRIYHFQINCPLRM